MAHTVVQCSGDERDEEKWWALGNKLLVDSAAVTLMGRLMYGTVADKLSPPG